MSMARSLFPRHQENRQLHRMVRLCFELTFTNLPLDSRVTNCREPPHPRSATMPIARTSLFARTGGLSAGTNCGGNEARYILRM
jgi:hypothetical protein